jgi:putative sterol carrier protein
MMEAKSPKEFFEKTLPARFKAEKAKDIDVVAQINISGPEGGNWTVTIKHQQLQVEEGIALSPILILKMNGKDFMELVNGKLSAEKAFFTGRVQFKGNIATALKLRDAGFL